jgi:hypothetical protein
MARTLKRRSKPLYKKKTGASDKDIRKAWKGYHKRTKGASRMSYARWLDFNYGKRPVYYKGRHKTSTSQALRKSGLSEEEIKRLGGR